jgi:hypothetical protein
MRICRQHSRLGIMDLTKAKETGWNFLRVGDGVKAEA